MSQDTPQVQSEDCGDLEIDFNYEILPDDFLQYDLSFKLIVIVNLFLSMLKLMKKLSSCKFGTPVVKNYIGL